MAPARPDAGKQQAAHDLAERPQVKIAELCYRRLHRLSLFRHASERQTVMMH
jgi:hypothetical protein